MKPLAKFTAFFDFILRLFTTMAGVILILLTVVISAGIIMRYYFKAPIRGLVELSEYSMLWITFLVAAWVLKDDAHIKMDVVLNMLRPKVRVVLNIITSILGTVTALGLMWYSGKAVLDLYKTGFYQPVVFEIPKAYVMAIIPVCSFLLFIQFLRRISGYFGELRAPSVGEKKRVISGEEF